MLCVELQLLAYYKWLLDPPYESNTVDVSINCIDCSGRLVPSSNPPGNKQMDKYKGGFIQKKLEWVIQSPTDKRQLVSCISQAAAFWHVLMVWAPVMEWARTRWHATPGGGGDQIV